MNVMGSELRNSENSANYNEGWGGWQNAPNNRNEGIGHVEVNPYFLGGYKKKYKIKKSKNKILKKKNIKSLKRGSKKSK